MVLMKTGGLEAVVPSGGSGASTPAASSAWEEPVVEGESGIVEGESGISAGEGGRGKMEGARSRRQGGWVEGVEDGRGKSEQGQLKYPSGSWDAQGAPGGPPGAKRGRDVEMIGPRRRRRASNAGGGVATGLLGGPARFRPSSNRACAGISVPRSMALKRVARMHGADANTDSRRCDGGGTAGRTAGQPTSAAVLLRADPSRRRRGVPALSYRAPDRPLEFGGRPLEFGSRPRECRSRPLEFGGGATLRVRIPLEPQPEFRVHA